MKIILNSAYVGNYGSNEGNLPHEVINFFQADNGNFYIYITPYGKLKPGLEVEEIRSILFVRNIGNGVVEILAKAELDDTSELFIKNLKFKSISQKHLGKDLEEESKRIYEERIKDIKYGKKSIQEIHKQNIRDNDIYVTMKVEGIYFPKKPIYLTNKKVKNSSNLYFLNLKKITNQSMIHYIDEKKNKSCYQTLEHMITKKENWKSKKETKKYDRKELEKNHIQENFFHVARQQNNEVMFSNLFYYLFGKYPALLKQFLKETIKDFDEKNFQNYQIYRERNHMDLCIISDTYYIIIENKIKSAINGIKVKENEKSIESQLSTYYEKAQKENIEEKRKRKIKGLLLTPNYNHIDLTNFKYKEKYTSYTYKDIYTLFKSFMEKNKEAAKDIYFQEFVKALKKHTEPVDNEYRDELLKRLDMRIKEK